MADQSWRGAAIVVLPTSFFWLKIASQRPIDRWVR